MDSNQEGPTLLTPGCADCDYKNGILMLDAKQRLSNSSEEHFIKRFVMTQLIQKQILEGVKEKLRFFNDHVVEVKSVAKGQSGNKSSQLSIYDFKNGITLYWTNAHASILEVEIENDAIYYLAENSTGGDKTERVLVKLYEMEDNVKIHTLMKKGLYTEAE